MHKVGMLYDLANNILQSSMFIGQFPMPKKFFNMFKLMSVHPNPLHVMTHIKIIINIHEDKATASLPKLPCF